MKQVKMLALAITAMLTIQGVQAQTVDEVINKYIETLGGRDKMLALKSIKLTGSLNTNGFDVSVVTTVVNGVGSRNDISVPGVGEGFQIMTPTKGWNFMPFGNGQTSPEEVGEDAVKAGQTSLDLQSPLLNYKEKGSQVELQGKETVEGAECYKLKITYKTGKTATWFIDTKNYYRVKTIATVMANGTATEVATTYSDFKKTADGYLFAYSQTNPRGTTVFSSVETNIPVDESIFTVK